MRAQYAHVGLNDLRQCYIYGAGQDASDFIERCHQVGVKVLGVFDDDPKKQGLSLGGYPIQATEALRDPGPGAPLIITTHRVALAAKNLCKLGISSFVPAWALQILHPDLFPPHMYYRKWAEDLVVNRHKYISLWNTLADETSRRIYEAIIDFKISFNPLVLLTNMDVSGEYFPEGVIKLTEDEVFVDGGAWTGDTIRVFKEKVKDNYERVYAFEPSPLTFQRLSENFAADPRVVPLNKGLYSQSAVLRFDDFGSTASRVSDVGALEVPVTTIDQAVRGGRVSFIKLNIEGAEAAAIRGAEATIRNYRPKMALCVYHSPRDIWEIPEVVTSIVDDYDFYLRHHDGGIIQLVLYAVPRS
jgi:FkbM family methyltransferase